MTKLVDWIELLEDWTKSAMDVFVFVDLSAGKRLLR